MKSSETGVSRSPGERAFRWRWLLLLLGCGFMVLIWPRRLPEPIPSPKSGTNARPTIAAPAGAAQARTFPPIRQTPTATTSAEELVANKLSQFARSRREYALALARRHDVQMSSAVERFFAAMESGDWEAIEAAFQEINGGDFRAGYSHTRSPDLTSLWPAIIDAYGVAEQVHLWPARKLLDYGNAILNSLRPGMVYVGGTDNGRWIPELLNDTSAGERHIIITQNALADATYREYLALQFEDRAMTLAAV